MPERLDDELREELDRRRVLAGDFLELVALRLLERDLLAARPPLLREELLRVWAIRYLLLADALPTVRR